MIKNTSAWLFCQTNESSLTAGQKRRLGKERSKKKEDRANGKKRPTMTAYHGHDVVVRSKKVEEEKEEKEEEEEE